MRIRRSFPIFMAVVLVAAVVAVTVALRKHAPPEAARLLPGADGFLYVNLQAVRHANLGNELPSVSHEPEYEQFIQATGFQFERDLDEAAFAIHNLVSTPGSNPAPLRFSEVFVGKIEGDRFQAYLRKISQSVEDYRSTDIYSIPLEGRVLRVALLGIDTVAASNQDDPAIIRGIIDRSRKLASPFGGPALLRKYYKYVPITNRYVPYAGLAWAIFPVEASSGPSARSPDLSFLFTKPAVIVASARAFQGLHVRTEAFTASEEDAKQTAGKINTFLSVFRSADAASTKKGPDPDVKQFFDSLDLKQSGSRVLLSANAPLAFIRKALAPPFAEPLAPGVSPGQPAAKPPKSSRK
jgi:hypothetical protein